MILIATSLTIVEVIHKTLVMTAATMSIDLEQAMSAKPDR
jgi:hypothetical protein